MQLYPSASVSSYPRYKSDHTASILSTRSWADTDKKDFNLEPMWFAYGGCMEVLESTWQSCHDREPLVKIGRCSEALQAWSKENFGNIKREIRNTKKLPKKVQKQASSAYNPQKCKALVTNLNDLHRKEER